MKPAFMLPMSFAMVIIFNHPVKEERRSFELRKKEVVGLTQEA